MPRFGRLLLLATAFASVQLGQLNAKPACSHVSSGAAAVDERMAGMDNNDQSGEQCGHVPIGRSCDQMGACVLLFTALPATSESPSAPLCVIEIDEMPKLASVLFAPELPPPRA